MIAHRVFDARGVTISEWITLADGAITRTVAGADPTDPYNQVAYVKDHVGWDCTSTLVYTRHPNTVDLRLGRDVSLYRAGAVFPSPTPLRDAVQRLCDLTNAKAVVQPSPPRPYDTHEAYCRARLTITNVVSNADNVSNSLGHLGHALMGWLLTHAVIPPAPLAPKTLLYLPSDIRSDGNTMIFDGFSRTADFPAVADALTQACGACGVSACEIAQAIADPLPASPALKK